MLDLRRRSEAILTLRRNYEKKLRYTSYIETRLSKEEEARPSEVGIAGPSERGVKLDSHSEEIMRRN